MSEHEFLDNGRVIVVARSCFEKTGICLVIKLRNYIERYALKKTRIQKYSMSMRRYIITLRFSDQNTIASSAL